MVKCIRKWKEGDPYLDEFDWNDLVDVLQDPTLSHNHKGGACEGVQIDHADLVNVTEDQHHPKHVKTLDDHPLSIIPTMDDAHVPDVDTLSYSNPFVEAQIPNLPASKITSERFPMARIPDDTDKYVLTAKGVGVDPEYQDPIQLVLEGVIFGAHINILCPVDLTEYGGDTGYSTVAYGLSGRIGTPSTAIRGVYRGSTYRSIIGEPQVPVFNRNPQFEVLIMLSSVTLSDAYVLFGSSLVALPYSATPQFGIRILNGALYTVSRNGATLTELNQNTSLSVDVWYRIRVKLISGNCVRTWVDGTQKTDKTTNLPSGVPSAGTGLVYIMRTGEAVAKYLYFHETRFMYGF